MPIALKLGNDCALPTFSNAFSKGSRAQLFRERANAARQKAGRYSDPDTKAVYLMVADQWELLALEVETGLLSR